MFFINLYGQGMSQKNDQRKFSVSPGPVRVHGRGGLIENDSARGSLRRTLASVAALTLLGLGVVIGAGYVLVSASIAPSPSLLAYVSQAPSPTFDRGAETDIAARMPADEQADVIETPPSDDDAAAISTSKSRPLRTQTEDDPQTNSMTGDLAAGGAADAPRGVDAPDYDAGERGQFAAGTIRLPSDAEPEIAEPSASAPSPSRDIAAVETHSNPAALQQSMSTAGQAKLDRPTSDVDRQARAAGTFGLGDPPALSTHATPNSTATRTLSDAPLSGVAEQRVGSLPTKVQPGMPNNAVEPERPATNAEIPEETAPSKTAATCDMVELVERLDRTVIRFRVASPEVPDAYTNDLQQLGEAVDACPGATVEISGHSDPLGAEGLNFELSWQRAEAVLAKLAELGFSTSAYITIGYGARQPAETVSIPPIKLEQTADAGDVSSDAEAIEQRRRKLLERRRQELVRLNAVNRRVEMRLR